MWHNKAWLSQVEEKNVGDAEQQTCPVLKSQAYIVGSRGASQLGGIF